METTYATRKTDTVKTSSSEFLAHAPNWKALKFCLSKDALRPAMLYVLMRIRSGYVTFVSTNGHVLYEESGLITMDRSLVDGDYLIDRETVGQLSRKIATGKISVSIETYGEKYALTFRRYDKISVSVSAPMTESDPGYSYPNYLAVFPETGADSPALLVDVQKLQELRDALHSFGLFYKYPTIAFTPGGFKTASVPIGPGFLSYEKDSPKYLKKRPEKSVKDKDCTWQVIPFDGFTSEADYYIGFNADFLIGLAKAMGKKSIRLELSAHNRAASYSGYGSFNMVRTLIMPVVFKNT